MKGISAWNCKSYGISYVYMYLSNHEQCIENACFYGTYATRWSLVPWRWYLYRCYNLQEYSSDQVVPLIPSLKQQNIEIKPTWCLANYLPGIHLNMLKGSEGIWEYTFKTWLARPVNPLTLVKYVTRTVCRKTQSNEPLFIKSY